MAMLQLTISVVIFVMALIASGHAVIYKREPRAAALWILVIWLIPAAGPILYLLLGVNRVRRQALAMRGEMVHHRATTDRSVEEIRQEIVFGPEDESFRLFSRLVERVTARTLVGGNDIVPLTNGIEAYPANLDRTFHLHFRWRRWREAVRRCSWKSTRSWRRGPRPHRCSRCELLVASGCPATA